MNAAQISAQDGPKSEYGWQNQAPCSGHDPDLFFDAAERDPGAADLAKDICHTCPIRLQCLDRAMLLSEDYGIWGGLTPVERGRYRPEWEREKGGKAAVRAMRERNGIFVHDPSIERRYVARLKAAQECRSRALNAADFPRRAEYLAVLELIIAHPTEDADSLASRAGFSRSWFNQLKRDVYDKFDVREVYESEEGEVA